MFDAVIATLSMLGSCIVGVIGVQTENANRGWLAGIAGGAGFLLGITYTVISVNVVDGTDKLREYVVLGLITIAVIIGTKLGQVLGRKILARRVGTPVTLEQRVEALERVTPGLRR